MVSVSASLATSKFNQLRIVRKCGLIAREVSFPCISEEDILNMRMGNFDSRVFQIADHEEVVNYFVWRYFDAIRNSKSMLAQSLYSPKQLNGKNTTEQQQMSLEKGVDWESLPFACKSGSFVVKDENDWIIKESPVFSKERDVILNLLKISEEDKNDL